MYCLYITYIKFRVPSASGLLVLKQKRGNGQERDITPQMFYGILSRVNQVI